VLLLAARMSGALDPAAGHCLEARRIDVNQARLAYHWRPTFRGICHPRVYPSAPDFETCPRRGPRMDVRQGTDEEGRAHQHGGIAGRRSRGAHPDRPCRKDALRHHSDPARRVRIAGSGAGGSRSRCRMVAHSAEGQPHLSTPLAL
jgi:hypothetical protein